MTTEPREEMCARLRAGEKELAALFANYMLLVSADAELRLAAGAPLFSVADESEATEALLKETDGFLRPYMEEFLGTVQSLSRAFRGEVADSAEE